MRSRKQQRPLHVWPPQVEVAILQPQFFVRQVLTVCARRHRRGDALVEQLEIGDAKLDLAGGVLRVRHAGRPLGDVAGHLDHVLGPQRLALFDDRRRRVGRIEHDLRDAVAVAEVDEQAAAVVAIAVDPATQRDGLADVIDAKFAAGMGSQHEVGSPISFPRSA